MLRAITWVPRSEMPLPMSGLVLEVASGFTGGLGGALLSEPGMPMASLSMVLSSTYISERVLGPMLLSSKSSRVTSRWSKSSVKLTWAVTLSAPTMGANS